MVQSAGIIDSPCALQLKTLAALSPLKLGFIDFAGLSLPAIFLPALVQVYLSASFQCVATLHMLRFFGYPACSVYIGPVL